MAVMLTNPLQVKDSRWLTLEVCREFTRNKCTRSETECKFAHPPPHVEVQNGRVTCCFDSIKGKCQRKDPPCKYLHPPQHLREQLLQNGRNNLILKNLQMQAIASSQIPQMVPLPPVSHQQLNSQHNLNDIYASPYGMSLKDKYRLNYGPNYQDQGQVLQAGVAFPGAAICSGQYSVHNPYLMQGASVYNPYMGQTMPMASVITNLDQGNQQMPAGMMQPNAGNQQKMQRADRLEPSTTSSGSGVSDSWPGSYVDSIAPSSHYSPVYFQGMSNLPTMMPMVKRPAVADSKSGIPMYQPGTGTAYQQAALAAMQLQQPFVPVTIAGHPPSVPRF